MKESVCTQSGNRCAVEADYNEYLTTYSDYTQLVSSLQSMLEARKDTQNPYNISVTRNEIILYQTLLRGLVADINQNRCRDCTHSKITAP